MILLDSVLPHYHVREFHSLEIEAPPEVVMDAAKALTLRELPFVRLLLAIRGLQSGNLDVPLIERFDRQGFALLGERPDELVLGVIGRFWRPKGNVRRTSAAEFEPFAAPGYAKAALNFRVEENGGGTLLSTETRVQAMDEHARRRFRCYWLIVRPGSGAIRHSMLRAVRREALRIARAGAAG